MDAARTGYVHSTESFGTVDGPGIRFVVFFQGCPLRCQYCHNPDTWQPGKGQLLSVDALLSQMRKNRPFYQNGGLTASGGEPLLQPDFLLSLFRQAKREGFHTCLDTSGAVFQNRTPVLERMQELMEYTDLVMLDMKHVDPQKHQALTGMDNAPVFAFARFLERIKKPLWVRHVVIPGITDAPASLESLGAFLASFSNLKALDVLAYHTLGIEKYKALGLSYPLEGVEPLSQEALRTARETILSAFRREREKGKIKL